MYVFMMLPADMSDKDFLNDFFFLTVKRKAYTKVPSV